MSETQNNIIRFNYLVDPTTLMSDSWITTNTDTTQNTVTPGELITRYWRTITFSINTGKSTVEGVFKVEVNAQGVPEASPYYENVSGSRVSNVAYDDRGDILTFKSGNSMPQPSGAFITFSTATENTDYTDSTTNTTCSYVASSTSGYDSYNVELYVNSDVTVFPNNLFFNDDNITSIEFDTYSITSLEDGIDKTSGAFVSCDHLTSVLLPDNLEYIGDFAFEGCDISEITLPSTLNEIGTQALYISKTMIITSLAVEPPIIHTQSLPETFTLNIHETAIQSYINSDWGNSVASISTIETPTYDNVLKFNYSTDPTTLLNNLWVNSCTDTSANTIEGKGEVITITEHWREVSYAKSFLGEIQSQGVIRIGWENNTYSGEFEVVETIKGDEINSVTYNDGTLTLKSNDGPISRTITSWPDFDTAVEGQEYSPSAQFTQTVSYTNTTTTIEAYSSYEATLYLNSALTTFETTIFENDTNLLSIELPGVITEIAEDTFNGCTNLTEITIYATNPPAIYPDTFTGISDEAVLYVPGRALKRYRSSGYSTYFASILAIYEPTGKGFNFAGMIDIDYMVEVDPMRYIR